MIAPWYIDTPLVDTVGRFLLAGSGKGKLEDVVDAGTRLMSDTSILSRALVVGPRATLDEYGDLVPPSNAPSDKEQGIWECYPHDLENVGMFYCLQDWFVTNTQCTDIFAVRMVRLFNAIEIARGWAGWGSDVLGIFTKPLRALLGR